MGVACRAVHRGAWWELSSIHKRQKVTVYLFSVKRAANLKCMPLFDYIYDPLSIHIHVSTGGMSL